MDITPIVARLSAIANAVNDLKALRQATFHEFLEVDLHKVYYYMQHDLGDLERFAQYVAKYLNTKSSHDATT